MIKNNEHDATKNSRGFMHPLSQISKEFIKFSSQISKPVIDIGCAYGIAVIPALQRGASVIACDIEQEHLNILIGDAKKLNVASKLTTQTGKFPQDFNFEENSISAVLTSHLLAFLNGQEIELGLQKIYKWLTPGGKLFILAYTPYLAELIELFIPEYERRIKDHVRWPGYVEDFGTFSTDKADKTGENNLPKKLHILDLPILKRELIKIGFRLEFAEYLNGKEQGAVPGSWYDGREYLGIIAVKD